MAKPAKVKKDSDTAAPAKKGAKKAAAGGKSRAKEAPAKGKGGKVAKAAKEEPKGLKGRIAKAQAAKAKPAKGTAKKERKGAGQFLREVRVELGKVTWPTREELIQSTMVVLIAVAIAGTFIAALDEIFSRLIALIS